MDIKVCYYHCYSIVVRIGSESYQCKLFSLQISLLIEKQA